MEGGEKTKNITDMKEKEESKIPKPSKLLSAKVTSSKTSEDKKTALNSRTTTKKVSITSSRPKQTQITDLPVSVKRMSVVKISKEVMNEFQDENFKSEVHLTDTDAETEVLSQENAKKRAPLKEKLSQVSQKQSESLPKKPSATRAKPVQAFGGMRFIAKKNTCQKFDVQKRAKESKDRQAKNPPESCTKQKKADSAKVTSSKETERTNEKNPEDSPTIVVESSKDGSLTVKEPALKKCTAFGGMKFTPKWQSTPLRPDLFENTLKVSKTDKESPGDSPAKWHEKLPNSAIAIQKEEETIIDDTTNLNKIVQPSIEETKSTMRISITPLKIADLYPGCAGIRFIRKRKSTHPKPDIFSPVQMESKIDGQKSHLPGTSSEQENMSSAAANAVIKAKTPHYHAEVLEQTSTQKDQNSETVSNTVNETNQAAFVSDLSFEPKWKSTPIRPDILKGVQKELKTEFLESHPADPSAKELKTISASTRAKIRMERQNSNVEKSEPLTTLKSESIKNQKAPNHAKKAAPPAFGGLRFKPRQKKYT